MTFAGIQPPVGGVARPPDPIPTIVPVSSSFFETDIEVKMDETEAANKFSVCIYGLGDDIYSLLVPVVHITLGYDDGGSKEVMTDLLTCKSLQAGDQWYEATLTGVDLIFDKLQRPIKKVNRTFPDKDFPNIKTVGDIAAAICKDAGVATEIPDKGPTLETISFKDETPFQALSRLAQIPRVSFSVQAKDGKLWMGTPEKLGATQTTPIDDGATSRPLVCRGATADANPMDGQHFNIAGLPALRPSDMVILGSDKFRVQSITHKLARENGYTCCGRAVSPGASHDDAQKAGRPSPSLVARQLRQNLFQRDRRRPAVDIGEINAYTAGDHTATLDLRHDATPDMPSPSIQATLRDKPVPLNDKPIASPFAFHNCGLVVPVYPKMRSLLAHSWNEPVDGVSNGFVWTSAMSPPKNESGDRWLCLPTELDDDGKPKNKGSDDLISKDGRRVIQVKGMKITIGSGLLNDVGDRPTPGTDESLTIQAGGDPPTLITFKAGQIEMTDGTIKLTLAGGKVSIGT